MGVEGGSGGFGVEDGGWGGEGGGGEGGAVTFYFSDHKKKRKKDVVALRWRVIGSDVWFLLLLMN